MKAIIEKLGRNPQRSLTIFLRGLGLFIVGIIFIVAGYFYHHIWQIIGIVVLFFACVIAAWGYLGIFANRWYNLMNKHQPKNKDLKF